MKLIEIVVHAFSGELPLYAALLKYQLRAISDNPPRTCNVLINIAAAKADDDPAVHRAFDEFENAIPKCVTATLTPLPKEQLFRRSIYRHRMCESAIADVLWFTDLDYLMLDGCLDAVASQVSRDDGLCFPNRYYCRKSPEEGDADWRAVLGGAEPVIDTTKFHQRRNRIAIGGLQIIGADYAKRIGYLGEPGSRWQRPANPDKPFRCFMDDSKWRKVNFSGGAGGRAIDVPNLYRLRHSKSSLTVDK